MKTGEIWKAGRRIKLQSQPFKVLAMLLEHPGEVISKEELQERIWGQDTNVEFEHSLATAVNRIRDALGDSASNPRFIETLARRGYRFIAPVTWLEAAPANSQSSESPGTSEMLSEPAILIAPAEHPAPAPSPAPAESHGTPSRRLSAIPARNLYIGIGLAAALGIFLGFAWGTRNTPSPLPRIIQLTDSGTIVPTGSTIEIPPASVTDGVQIYTSVVSSGQGVLARIPVGGGDAQPLRVPQQVLTASLGDISPDHTELLVKGHLSTEAEEPLWIVPVGGGSAFRVSNVLAHDATWMPDGKSILYATGSQLMTVRLQDGAVSPFTTLSSGRAFWMRWSPDGSLLRFTVVDPVSHATSLWQLATGSHQPRKLLDSWKIAANPCCGTWTADGKYFVFQAISDAGSDLWRLDGASLERPYRITAGPLGFGGPVADRSGGRIYFLGTDSRSQLFAFDTHRNALFPEPDFLSGAIRLAFSRDHQWVAWTDSHDRLWRARADGSERIQLTPNSLHVFLATWSPDGQHLAAMAAEPRQPWNIYILSSDGGSLVPLLHENRNAADPSWSADGKSLVFGRVDDLMGRENAPRSLEIVDLATNKTMTIPHSDGLFSPRWSPDGRYISAITLDQQKLMLYDTLTRTWTTLANSSVADPAWSTDSHAVYIHAFMAEGQPVYRVSVPDGHMERVTNLVGLQAAHPADYYFCGLTPDNSPLVRVRFSAGDLYSLDLEAH
ncbi:winged helix-turn-helix domain-containing protein [Silvibacterium dinghuense]|uniref:winged helix-turn-helix domain-containing protein n=1 Tax=Silvibacterium dinghuense TaxID=1560006 RepID=UPI0019BA4660|nr:winged helix-turn-helix domain-containing protein [Silvibacterium dinghuense]GGG93940.1 biopolymer transporter Tol [Silvibacterium dinghuense]